MKINEAKKIITSLIKQNIKIPVLLLGPPGIGKTEIFSQIKEELDMNLLIFEGSSLDPTDVRGLPLLNESTTHFSMSPLHPRAFYKDEQLEKPGIILIDELAFASKLTQRALNALFLLRRLGVHNIPDNYFVFATGNPPEYGGDLIINTLVNRIIMLKVEPNLEDWLDNYPIHPMIRSFLRLKPNFFYTYKPEEQDQPYATPRSWSMISRLLNANIIDRELYIGTVGPAGSDFYVYATMESLRKIDVDKVLNELIIYDNFDLQMYLNECIIERIRTNKIHKNMVIYALKLAEVSKELAYLLIKNLAHSSPSTIITSGKLSEIKTLFGDTILACHIMSKNN